MNTKDGSTKPNPPVSESPKRYSTIEATTIRSQVKGEIVTFREFDTYRKYTHNQFERVYQDIDDLRATINSLRQENTDLRNLILSGVGLVILVQVVTQLFTN